MRVRLGWSGETEPNVWQKADVSLEEEDLARLLREQELPESVQDKLPTAVCFQLMQNEAEFLLLTRLIVLGYPKQTAAERIGVLAANSKVIVTALKKALV